MAAIKTAPTHAPRPRPKKRTAVLTASSRLNRLRPKGEFWTDDELIRIQGSGRSARQMGHMPISGADGSLQKLSDLQRPRKIFIHVNNTNPMLDEDSAEYRRVRESGWEVAEDGWQFDL